MICARYRCRDGDGFALHLIQKVEAPAPLWRSGLLEKTSLGGRSPPKIASSETSRKR
jgi:hypothetical protein